ncbi:MAG TPA: glycosyltransferase family 2 protein [Xanthobacteraceae bacterium]|nr:glycosyltransferase family 2 protein [Xanthobacteraceae bacterium]
MNEQLRVSMALPQQARPRPRLSIVAPCYNEESGIEEFHRRMTATAKETAGTDYELILINDGSSDRTWQIMLDLAESDPQLVAINLSRRHGHQRAMTAGLHSCRGDRVLTIDSDLQDPPELLGEMWRLMDRVEADVVYGQRRERHGETMLKRGTAALFYRLLRQLADSDMQVDSGDFRLMSRKVTDILNAMPEQQRFIRGMVSWIGLRQVALAYDRAARTTGTSNYSLGRMFGLAFDALTSFSIMPLRLASYLGMILGFLSLLMLGYTLGSWAFGHVVEGWTSLSTLILVLGSMQLILFGLLGEYVGRLYLESKRRPLFVIDEIRTGENVSMPPAAYISGERHDASGEGLN